MKKTFYFFILLLVFYFPINAINNYPFFTFCTDSIIDVISHPMGNEKSTFEDVRNAYAQLPISWQEENDKAACPRIYQLLLHELVLVLEEHAHEALVQILNCFIVDKNNNQQPLQGWVLKEHLATNVMVKSYKQYVPSPLFRNDSNKKYIALVSPYKDENGTFYSAGTRFVLAEESDDYYYVYSFDKTTKSFQEISLPSSICSLEYENKTLHFSEKKELFCKLVSLWAHIKKGFIPLVWGGASIGKVWDQADYFESVHYDAQGNEYNTWDRPRYGNNTYMGIDSSMLVLRAAQLVGIPYYYRNSTTATAFLPHKDLSQEIENGDLLWVPGGLLIVNNVEHNMIVTTMSYNAGYGCVIELPLSDVFKEISTYQDLRNAIRNDKDLTLLDHKGNPFRTIRNIKIFTLPY